MAKRIRRLFSAEFKLEAAQLVLDQNYSVLKATNAMGAGKVNQPWINGFGNSS
jgi:transposase